MSKDYSNTINQILASISEIQQSLGDSPGGIYANTKIRLDIIESKLNNLLESKINAQNNIPEKPIAGKMGLQGLQGSTGLQGKPGKDGLQGSTGQQGQQGHQGVIGLQGKVGLTGSQGLIGLQGLTGLQGSSGLHGSIGLQGSVGLQGAIGLQGNVGEIGLQGAQGLQGSYGNNGAQGYTGAQGNQGYRGYQGYSGIPGENGLQGAQGYQGDSGSTINSHSILFGNSTNIKNDRITYCSVFNNNCAVDEMENKIGMLVPLNCILSNLYVVLDQNIPEFSSYQFTIRKNNSDTLLSVVIDQNQYSAFNIINNVSFNAGDIFSISITPYNSNLLDNLSVKWSCKLTSI